MLSPPPPLWQADAAFYASEYARLVAAFDAAFFNSKTGVYSTGTQMAQGAALWLDAVPAIRLATTVSALADDVTKNGLTFGFLGVQYVFEALARHNRTDAAIECLLRTGDGYGHEVYNLFEPATSLWESWDGDTMHQWVDESSRSHHYQASISTFLRRYVAGLDVAPGSAGWAVVRVRPEGALLPPRLAAQLPAAAARVATHRGTVGVSWALRSGGVSNGSVSWSSNHSTSTTTSSGTPGGTDANTAVISAVEVNVTLPATSTGEVHVPKSFGSNTRVLLGDQVVWEAGERTAASPPGLVAGSAVVDDGRFISFQTAGGSWAFRCEPPA